MTATSAISRFRPLLGTPKAFITIAADAGGARAAGESTPHELEIQVEAE